MKKIFKFFCIFALLFCSAQAWGQATEGEDWQQDDGLDNNYWKEEWEHIDKEEAEPGGGNTDYTVTPLDTITMMTYNVLHQNFQYDSNTYKYANVISGVGPDVLALQELIDREIFNNLKALTGMGGEMLVTHKKNQGTGKKENGLGILWNLALGIPNITTKKLPLWGWQVGYMVAEFRNFCFVSTHYPINTSNQEEKRRKTTKKILNDKVVKRCKNSGKPVYIAGDFNEEPDNPNGAIQLFVNEGFEVLNDPTKVWSTEEGKDVYELTTGPNKNQIDLIIEYNIYQKHKIINQSKPDDFFSGNPSDHKPYYVKVKIR